MGALRGTAWGASSFFHLLKPWWFLQPEVVGMCLPGARTLGGGPRLGLGLLTSEISLPSFYPLRVDVGPACFTSSPLLPVWMDVSLIRSCHTAIQLDFCRFSVTVVLYLSCNLM